MTMDLVYLVTMPFSLVNLALLLGVRAATLVCFRLIKAMLSVPLDLCWKATVFTIALVTLPLRLFTALHREKTLEMSLNELQILLESLACENKELEKRLQIAIKDRKVIETIFEEIEEEHGKALSRIDLLENELQDIKEENLRLKEFQGKVLCGYKAHDDRTGYVHEGIPLAANFGIPSCSWGASYKGSGRILEDILVHDDSWGKGDKVKSQEQYLLKVAGSCRIPPPEISRDLIIDGALEQQRVVAIYRSLFSAMLSLLVGMIILEAEDPCLPLVAALFIVVGMSLSSVVQFFSTIRNKPASDAVALLSINWFILGTLTSPSLPSITRMLAPWTVKLADPVASWLGLSAYLRG